MAHVKLTRAEVIKGLRDAADYLERNPAIQVRESPLPLDLTVGVEGAEQLAGVARALGHAHKKMTDYFASIEREIGGGLVKVGAYDYREKVCERIVVGTREVERPVPSTETEIVTEEIVEWDCSPLLDTASLRAVK